MLGDLRSRLCEFDRHKSQLTTRIIDNRTIQSTPESSTQVG
jgi:hypothetical protein